MYGNNVAVSTLEQKQKYTHFSFSMAWHSTGRTLVPNVLSNYLIQSIFSPSLSSSLFFFHAVFCSLKNRFVMITHVINKLLKAYLNKTCKKLDFASSHTEIEILVFVLNHVDASLKHKKINKHHFLIFKLNPMHAR